MNLTEDNGTEDPTVLPFPQNEGQETPSENTSVQRKRFRFEELYTVVGGQYVMPKDGDEGFP